MAVIKTLEVSAQNTFSAKFTLVGDYALSRHEQRRALICATRDDSPEFL